MCLKSTLCFNFLQCVDLFGSHACTSYVMLKHEHCLKKVHWDFNTVKKQWTCLSMKVFQNLYCVDLFCSQVRTSSGIVVPNTLAIAALKLLHFLPSFSELHEKNNKWKTKCIKLAEVANTWVLLRVKPGSYHCECECNANLTWIWRHNSVFAAIFSRELSTTEPLRMMGCEFVTSAFVAQSHSQEVHVWTWLYYNLDAV